MMNKTMQQERETSLAYLCHSHAFSTIQKKQSIYAVEGNPIQMAQTHLPSIPYLYICPLSTLVLSTLNPIGNPRKLTFRPTHSECGGLIHLKISALVLCHKFKTFQKINHTVLPTLWSQLWSRAEWPEELISFQPWYTQMKMVGPERFELSTSTPPA